MLKEMASAQFMGLVEEEPEKPSGRGQAAPCEGGMTKTPLWNPLPSARSNRGKTWHSRGMHSYS